MDRSLLRVSTAADLRDLFEQGELTLCLNMLGEPSNAEHFVLWMRAMLRLQRHHEVLRRASFNDYVERAQGSVRAQMLGLLATAYFRAGMRAPAEAAMAAAESTSGATAEDIHEIAYYRAIAIWSDHRFDQCEVMLDPLVRCSQCAVKAYELRAWCAAGRSDYAAQAREFRAALMAPAKDRWHTSTALWGYSNLARDLYLKNDVALITRFADAFPWTGDMAKQEFYTYKNIALYSALEGNTLRAFEYYVRAERTAATPAHRVFIATEKALLAHALGQLTTAQENIARADANAMQVHWADVGDDRTALLEIALAHALLGDRAAAESYWSRYSGLKSAISPIYAYGNGDARLAAQEQYTLGHILELQGDRRGASAAFKAALRTWRDIGYLWRAVLAAMAMARSSSFSYLAQYAVVVTDRDFPRAWFSTQLNAPRRRMTNAVFQDLSETKQGVVLGLLAGRTNREIAADLDISVNVVRNHFADLFDRFTPHDRNQRALIATLRALGI